MTDRTSRTPAELETAVAVRELLDVLSGIPAVFLEGERAVVDEQARLEGFRWMFSILAVGLDVYVWADTANPRFIDIVAPNRKWGGDNADSYYQFAPIDPARTYRVRGRRGDAVYLSLTVYGGPNDGHYSSRIVQTLNSTQFDVDENGEYELVLSAARPDDVDERNWLRLEPDAVAAITRDYLADPVNGRRATWSITALDRPPTVRLRDDDLARRFNAVTTWLREQLSFQPIPLGETNQMQEPYPVPQTTFGWAAGDAAYAMGAYDLGPDQCLVIEGTSPDCVFWNCCLWNQFLHTFDYEYERVTINGEQLEHNDDGSWTIVIAERDPGHPNWVSTQGHRQGVVWFRWFLPAHTPAPMRTRVEPVS